LAFESAFTFDSISINDLKSLKRGTSPLFEINEICNISNPLRLNDEIVLKIAVLWQISSVRFSEKSMISILHISAS
jgi:hypothetical protein